MLPYQLVAVAVDRSDTAQRQELQLLLDTPFFLLVFRSAQRLPQCFAQFSAHIGGGSIGEGHHQKPI